MPTANLEEMAHRSTVREALQEEGCESQKAAGEKNWVVIVVKHGAGRTQNDTEGGKNSSMQLSIYPR
jgi:hypothetical protein